MKSIKKIFAVIIAMTMALMLALPAFADDATPTYTITISNSAAGHVYEAYQVFTGDLSGENGLSNVAWGEGVDSATLLAALKTDTTIGIDFSSAAGADDVATAIKDANAVQAGKFAQVVGSHLVSSKAISSTAGESNYTITVPKVGYYFVKDKADSLTEKDDAYTSFILKVAGAVTVTPKSGKPTVEKKVAENSNAVTGTPSLGEAKDETTNRSYNDVADYDIGDSIPFQLTANIPAGTTTDYSKYHITFNDTMSAGLTLNKTSVKVYALTRDPVTTEFVKAAMGSASYHVAVTDPTDSDKNTHITVDVQIYGNETVHDNPLVGQFGDGCKAQEMKIYVEYTAKLNENAAIGLPGNPNEVYLTYSNNPNEGGEGSEGKTPKDEVLVFTYELDSTKVDGTDNTKLKDAEFVLYKGTDADKKYVRVGAAGKVTGWTATKDAASKLTSAATTGMFKVIGLDEGTYYLEETKAPTGYNKLANPIKLVIAATTKNDQGWTGDSAAALTALTISADGGAASNGDLDTGIVSTTVKNNKGPQLPSTGGMGTTLFTILGIALMAGAAVLLVAKRRANK